MKYFHLKRYCGHSKKQVTKPNAKEPKPTRNRNCKSQLDPQQNKLLLTDPILTKKMASKIHNNPISLAFPLHNEVL